jgi:hypothetical protein
MLPWNVTSRFILFVPSFNNVFNVKNSLVAILKELGAKMKWLAENRQSENNFGKYQKPYNELDHNVEKSQSETRYPYNIYRNLRENEMNILRI